MASASSRASFASSEFSIAECFPERLPSEFAAVVEGNCTSRESRFRASSISRIQSMNLRMSLRVRSPEGLSPTTARKSITARLYAKKVLCFFDFLTRLRYSVAASASCGFSGESDCDEFRCPSACGLIAALRSSDCWFMRATWALSAKLPTLRARLRSPSYQTR